MISAAEALGSDDVRCDAQLVGGLAVHVEFGMFAVFTHAIRAVGSAVPHSYFIF